MAGGPACGDGTLLDRLQRWARERPDARAFTVLRSDGSERDTLTFDQLSRHAQTIAERLRETLAPGSRAILACESERGFIEAFLACQIAGIVAVPASVPRYRQGAGRLAAIARHCEARALLGGAQSLDALKAALGTSVAPDLHFISVEAAGNAAGGALPSVRPDDVAMIQYTSGSTGAPKGAVLTHRNLMHNEGLIAAAFGHGENTVFAGVLPLFHDMGLIGNVLQPLYLGIHSVLISPASFLKRPACWLQAISRYRATTSGGPNFVYDVCVDRISDDELADVDLSRWSVAFNGAEPISATSLERFGRRFRAHGFSSDAFFPCYGLAEATLLVAGGPPGRLALRAVDREALGQGRIVPPQAAGLRLVGSGRPAMPDSVRIVDTKTCTALGPDTIGEIWVRTESVAQGYWSDPRATQETFAGRLRGETAAYLRTGDLGFLDGGGMLFVTGRSKDVLIVRGQNFYPQDLEETVRAADARLGRVAAFESGGENRQIVIVAEAARNATRAFADAEASAPLFAALRTALYRSHGIAAGTIAIVPSGALPRTTSGKLRRSAAADAWASGAFAVVASEHAPLLAPAAAAGGLETILASALGVAESRLPSLLPLVAQGIDSLRAAALADVLATHGIACPMNVLLAADSLEEIRRACSPVEVGVDADENGQDTVPLGPWQQPFWFAHEMRPHNAANNVRFALRVGGEFDAAAWAGAVRDVIARHEALRATIHAPDGTPRQTFGDPSADAVTLVDGSAWSEGQVEGHVTQAVNAPFDLAQGPVFRAEIVRTRNDTILIFAAHHAVTDLWSMAAVLHECAEVYAARREGRTPRLPPAPRLGAVLAAQAAAQRAARDADLAFWGEALGGEIGVLELPRDRTAPRHAGQAGGRVPFAIDAGDLSRLRALCADAKATLHMALLALYRVLLYRYSGQPDIVIGTPLARRAGAAATLVGCLTNPVAVRCAAEGGSAFLDVLGTVRGAMLGAMRHGDLPFHDIVRERGGARPDSGSLFQTMFALQQTPEMPQAAPLIAGSGTQTVHVAGLEVTGYPLDRIEVPFDLALMIAEGQGRLWGFFEYRMAVLDRCTVERLATHFGALLKQVVAHPHRPISSLEMLDADDLAQLARLEQASEPLPPPSACIHDLIAAQARRTPNAVAVRCNGRDISYAHLQSRAERLAGALVRMGVGPEDRVAVALPPSAEWIVALLAVWNAGAALVPLDAATPPQRLSGILRDAKPRAVLCEEGAPMHEAAGGLAITLPSLEAMDAAPVRCAVPPQAAAYLAFTSGSAGTPKGVIVPHEAACNFAEAQRSRLDAAALRRVLQITPPSFDAALSDVFMALTSGGTLCIAPAAARVPGRELANFIRDERVTLVTVTPSVLASLDAGGFPDLAAVISMGEACTAETARQWSRACAFYNGYGPTEAAIGATLGRFDSAARTRAGNPGIGEPFANYRLHVLDAHRNRMPVGAAGGIYIGGAGVARGYAGRPGWTAERFVPDPFGPPGARMYFTGDRARWLADGGLEFLGRGDRQVKLRGVRIEPAEIETALREYAAVRDCFVDVAGDAAGGMRLVAYVVGPAPGELDGLRNFLRGRLPPAMMPARFVPLAAIPVRLNGKIDRAALPPPDALPPPEAVPASDLEARLRDAWSEVLGFAVGGIDDNFFDLGGHSLLLHRLQIAVEARTGRSAPLLAFFDHPTIRAFARHLGEPAARAAWRAEPAGFSAAPGRAPIAVVGMAGRFPGAPGIEAYWRNIVAGKESISFFTPEELAAAGVEADDAFVPARGVVDGVELFDAAFFGISPREAEILDPQKRLLLELAQMALDDAGYAPAEGQSGDTGVFVGLGRNSYFPHNVAGHTDLVQSLGPIKVGVASDPGFAATLIAYKLNLSGPCLNVDTACSTSLVAVHQACLSLWAGECRMALAGGASIDVPVPGGHRYEEGLIASPDGHCRAFDAAAAGTVKGMGAGLVVLKRLDAALEDGDHIHAVIRGSAVNNDGAHKIGFTAPSAEGQAEAIRRALGAAGVPACSLGYIEAHGTGTALGDPIEIAALNRALEGAPATSIAIGSVKSNIGHLDAAAGIAGFIKCALVVSRGLIPPQLHLREPNPRIDWHAGPLYVPAQLRAWPETGGPRRAGVSSFGIGGTNAHVVLEQPPPVPQRTDGQGPWLFALSAASQPALRATAAGLAAALRSGTGIGMADAAFTLAKGRRQLRRRASFVAGSREELARQLDAGWSGVAAGDAPRVALVFAGESVSVSGHDMTALAQEPSFSAALERCRAALGAEMLPAWDRFLQTDAPPDSRIAFPAIVAAEYALASFLLDQGVRPGALIGHGGLGELAAACVGGALPLEDALRLACEWGRLAVLCPQGAMLDVRAPADDIETLLLPGVAVAAIDGPVGCLLSGVPEVIARQEDVLRRASRHVTRLAADRAFHSNAMSPACAPLKTFCAQIRWSAPAIPIYSSATAERLRDAAQWSDTLCQPLRLAGTLKGALGEGAAFAIGIGASETLVEALRAHPAVGTAGACALAPSVHAHSQALEALGRLWERGVSVDLPVAPGRRIPLPGVAFERTRVWLDPVARLPAAPMPQQSDAAPAAAQDNDASRLSRAADESWRQFLGVGAVGPDDDFFSLGGDSLLAIELAALLGERLGVKLAPRILFEQPRFADFCAHLATVAQRPAAAAPMSQAPPSSARSALSAQQRSLWLAHRVEGASASLNLSFGLNLDGPVDLSALQAAFRCVLQRHGILLHNFDTGAGEGEQWRAHEPASFAIAVEDVAAGDMAQRAQREANAPFAIAQDLLVRAVLLRVGASEHLLLVTVHHLVADGWSLLVMLRELAALYADPDAALPEARSYAGYVESRKAADANARALAYWSERLRDLPLVEFPTDKPQAVPGDDRGRSLSLVLPPELTRAIRAACRQQGTTLFAHLLAAFQILVRLCAGHEDVVVASPLSNRNDASYRDTVGPFVGLALFRARISLDQPFRDVAAAVRNDIAAVLSHAEIALEEVPQTSGLRRADPHESPFRIAFALNNAMPSSVPLGRGVSARPVMPPRERSRHRAMMWIDEGESEIRCTLECRAGLYEEAAIARYLKAFARVLEAVTHDPSLPARRIDLLDEDDRRALEHWNDTAGPLPSWSAAQHEIARVAAANPQSIALAYEGTQITYADLDAQSRRIARLLLERGVGIEEPVGVFLDRGPRMIAAALGILYAGACYVPLDPTLPDLRIRGMIESSAMRFVVADADCIALEGAAQIVDPTATPADSTSVIALPVPVAPQNLAYILFTSGSTGRPKGVMVDHRALANRLDWMIAAFGIGPADRILHKTPMGFDVSLWEIFVPLLAGGTMIIARPGGHRDPSYIQSLLLDEGVTFVHFVPSLLQLFLEQQPLARPPALRHVVCSGEALRTELCEKAGAWLGDRRKTVNLYGPTEAAIDVTAWVNETAVPDRAVTIGRPIRNIRAAILDVQQRCVPVGTIGELYIGGVGLARGYAGAPHLTAAQFVPDPFGNGERLYRTGDRARWTAGGEIAFHGRTDSQVKLRGMRVEVEEIEAVLRQSPQLSDAAVSVADGERLVAHVVAPALQQALNADCEAATDEALALKSAVRVFAATRLPQYMVPHDIVVVARLPVSANGKLDRAALPPRDPWTALRAQRSEPVRDIEKTLAKLWHQAVGGDAPALEDDFFEAGGNSLAAVRLVAAVQAQMNLQLELQQLFEHPTLGALARQLAMAAPSAAVQIVPAPPQDRYAPFPMTEVQQAYAIGRSGAFQLGNVSTHGYLEMDVGALDRARFAAALDALIRRHDMLRAVAAGPAALRVLESVPAYESAFLDLRGKESEDSERAIADVRAEMSAAAFDLESWPLFEIRITQLAGERHIVHLGIDALIVDGASVVILERDLNRLYLEGADAPLPALSLGYRDCAVARPGLRAGAGHKRARAYWLRRLDSLPEAPKLPLRAPLGTIRTPHFVRRQALLPAAAWQSLCARGTSSGATAAAIVLAAYAEVLAQWSGETHFLLNLPVVNRPPLHPDIDAIVGNFTSTVLLEIDLDGKPDFRELARRINRRLWADVANADFDGVELQRMRARLHRTYAEARTPIVFTGLLGLDGSGDGAPKPFDLRRELTGVSQTSQVLLDCIAVEGRSGLILNWDHVAEAFPEGMIDEMFEAMLARLHSLASGDTAWQTRLPAQRPPWRAEGVDIVPFAGAPATLIDPVLAAAARFADRVAIVSGSVALSYGELHALAGGIAAQLQARGARRGDAVAIFMEKGWEQVAAALGILMAGCAYVPVEAGAPVERQRHMLADSGARIALTQPHLAAIFPAPGLELLSVRRDGPRDAAAPEAMEAGDLAYIIFTSGSTGRPKGVAITHGAAANTIAGINERFAVTADDSVLAVSGLGFDLSVYDIFGLLAAGGKIVFPDPGRLFEAGHWWHLIARHGITLWNTTPALAAHLIAGADAVDAPALRLFLLSGDWIPLDLPARLRALLPHAHVESLGGATEAAIWSISYPIGAVQPGWKSIPYGRPLRGQDVMVLNADLAHCPSWVTGDIHIAGHGLALGYWNDAQQTAKSFPEHPRWRTRLYRTGDLGRYLPDGNIEFLGRIDGQVKIHGVRLELGEVESYVEAQKGIAQAAVLADRQGGRDVQRLAAYVALAEDAVSAGVGRVVEMPVQSCAASWQAVLAGADAAMQMDSEAATVDAQSLAAIVGALEGQYRNALVDLFTGFGRFAAAGDRVALDTLMHEEGIAPRYRRWMARALSYLEGRGVLRRLPGGVFEVVSDLAALRDATLTAPPLALEKILREDVHSAQLYAAGGMAASYQAYYRLCHRIAASVLGSFAGVRRGTEPLRILEVGAGYGSVTEHLLPRLQPGDRYVFTDVSPFFLSRARERFAAWPGVTYEHFDVDIDPQAQGHPRHGFDAVIAASVLHNARDIPHALANLRSALAPGGLLLLIEETAFFPFFNLGMGLQQGFDDFDDALRIEHPLLPREAWGQAFARAGFVNAAVLHKPGTMEDALGFDVLAAQAPAAAVALDAAELCKRLENHLPRLAMPSVWIQVDALPRNANGKIDRRGLRLPEKPRAGDAGSYVAPRNDTERTLAGIWCRAMDLPRIGVTDNFFDAGGDSLVASRVIGEIRERLSLDIQLQALFEATTIETLAALIAMAQPRPPAAAGFVEGEL